MHPLFLSLILRARWFWRMLSLRAVCSDILLVFISFSLNTRLLLRDASFALALAKKLAMLLLFSLLLTGIMKSGELFPTLPTSFETG